MDALKRHEIYRCISAPEVSRASRVADASRPAISRFIGEFGGRDLQGQLFALSKKCIDSSPSELDSSDRRAHFSKSDVTLCLEKIETITILQPLSNTNKAKSFLNNRANRFISNIRKNIVLDTKAN
ncbi:PREDICTED: uncharacterized protein LOC108689631 [Atta colombica]|uniref:uncharacterized protein LOC108689631 n=1 Tax=Atta colombica TaxID=520822 RepID=UPI00084CBEFB|nr:PREDICTED: uncharacterized protein LOC108689631 [Atta colombica]